MVKDEAMSAPSVYKVCRVHWQDSACSTGWHKADEITEFCNTSISKIETVGWLVFDAPDYIVVAQSMGKLVADNLLQIPRFAITDLFIFDASAKDFE